MKKFMILFATIAFLASCSDDDDPIIPKDYGMKTFSADMRYTPHEGMSSDFNYKLQTYMKLGEPNPIATGTYGEDNWTTFNILPKVPNDDEELIDNKDYNVTTTVKNWDLLFTQYIGNAMKGMGPGVMPYFLAGVLINTDRVEVGLHSAGEELAEAELAESFNNLTLNDVTAVTYSSEIDYIGIDWKSMSGMPPTYTPKSYNFYIIKTTEGDIYKLRFVGIYGKDKNERIFKCEYALMK